MRLLIPFLALCCLAAGQSKPAADLIVSNAKIWTADKNLPRAEAVAIIGEHIVAVGSTAEIEAWRGSATRMLDAGGRLVVPGFNDAHVHLVDGGRTLENVSLRYAKSPEEFARILGERAKKTPKGEWIVGGDWDDQQFTPPRLPTRQMIDAATGDVPVFVNRYDGHMALANSAALKLAGVTAATKDVPGGEIVRDAKGEPTGVLKDAAMAYVYKVIPPLSAEARMRAIKNALKHAALLGVTSLQDMNPSRADVAAYMELEAGGELTARIYAAPHVSEWQDQAKLGIRRAFGSTYLRLGALKGYADGSLGSTTAYFFDPYLDAPRSRGLLSDELQPLDAARKRLIDSDAAGLQLCMHAIGDRAIAIMLDLFEDVIEKNGARDRRLRIEHAQHLAPADFARFARMGVIGSVQPYHAIDDGRWAERRIGHERAKTTYAFRTFLDHNVRLALGTDWYVAPLNPMLTLDAAVSRATLDGKHPEGWVPQEKIKVEEALLAYTLGSAYAEFQDAVKGSVTVGKLADLVVLSDDLFTIAPERIKDVKVVTTIVGGRVVFGEE